MYTLDKNLNFTDYFYNKLPRVYRVEDQGAEQLKRYLGSIIDAGFIPALNSTLSLEYLHNPEKCPSRYLPILCQHFGVTYFPDIDEKFQRKFLSIFMELNMRKGTSSCLEYLARELSGYDVKVSIQDTVPNSGDMNLVVVSLESYEDDEQLLTKQSAIERYILNYVPTCMDLQVVNTYYYSDSADFITASIEEVFKDQYSTSSDSDPSSVVCSESLHSAIISSLGMETGFNGIQEDKLSLTNGVSATPDWFNSNSFCVVDKITKGGTVTINFS